MSGESGTTEGRGRRMAPRSGRWTQEMVQRVAEADLTLAEMAKAGGVSLIALGEWVARPGVLRTLEGLAKLADVRAQLIVSRFRSNAAAQLIQIASAGEPNELSRKACVDLLRADLAAFAEMRSGTGEAREAHGARAPSEAAILRALEQLGEQV